MLDFRYHALSLVAVFLALAIGIVLGVTIGDSLLSEADRAARNSLRSDVVDARDQADDARAAVRTRDEFIERVAPGIVRDRLTGRRVAVVSWGPLPDKVEDGVREAVRDAGGRVDSVSRFEDPMTDLRAAIGQSAVDAIASNEGTLRSFGRRLARALLTGGAVTSDLRDLEGERFQGRYLAADVAVYFRAPDRSQKFQDALEDGIIEGLAERAASMVAVEASDADPSQVSFYRGKELTSVDSVDQPPGRVALVVALAGAQGTFGLKPSAREPLPDSDELGF